MGRQGQSDISYLLGNGGPRMNPTRRARQGFEHACNRYDATNDSVLDLVRLEKSAMAETLCHCTLEKAFSERRGMAHPSSPVLGISQGGPLPRRKPPLAARVDLATK